jgi:peptide/nickel transport system substrate-binding protein
MKRKLLIIPLVFLLASSLVAIGCAEDKGGVDPGDWGEPEYGDTLVYRAGFIDVITNPLDPRSTQFGAWIETLFHDDKTVDREEFGFGSNFYPLEYRAGRLAESWSQPDPLTIVVKLRQGVTWQDKPPAYGRPFTSADVVYTYDKVLGVGQFAGEEGDPFLSSLMPHVTECVATDDYTVEFHLSSENPFNAYEILMPWLAIPPTPYEYFELTPEEQADWHNAPGTGAFVLTDFVAGTSITATANPNYYGVDPRYDDNPLPYLDEVKILVIPDMATALSALRTGEIDMLVDAREYPTLSDTQSLAATHPQINHFQQNVMAPGIFFKWNQDTGTIDPPFDDIRVRKAMQLAINLEEIAETFFQGTVDGEPVGLMSPLSGEEWDFSFDEWPSELQEEYTYDLEAAQQLMADAGHAGGFDTEILSNPADAPEVLEIVQSMLLDIGIDMTINSVGMMEQRPMTHEGDYVTLWASIGGSTMSTPGDVIQSFYSKKFERLGVGGGVIDAGYDAIVERFFAATTLEAAAEVLTEADQYWLEQHWAVITFPAWSNQFSQPWVCGYQGERFWGPDTWAYIAHCWINSELKAEYK